MCEDIRLPASILAYPFSDGISCERCRSSGRKKIGNTESRHRHNAQNKVGNTGIRTMPEITLATLAQEDEAIWGGKVAKQQQQKKES